MTTASQKLTVADVMEIIEDKLDEAKDFLDGVVSRKLPPAAK